MSEFKLDYYKLPKLSSNIFNYSFDLKNSTIQNEPLLSLGFYYYLHQTKDKMEILNDDKYKNKDFYLVVNNFEHKVNDYVNDIQYNTKKYFNINDKEKQILSRAFYKLWEILFLFDILPNKESILTSHLAEGPGAFVQATIMFRDKFNSNLSKQDKYCAITLDENNKEVPNLNKKKLECYSNKTAQRYYQHKFSKNDNGDLTKLNVINNYVNNLKKFNDKATLVTADGGFVWKNENYQEQESYKLLLGEIITAIKIQKEGGTFVLKVFDIFTKLTIKLICIIQSFYEDVFIYKPFLSRSSNSEKYIIAKNFKKNNNYSNNLLKLENLLEDINKLEQNKYIFDIVSDYEIPDELFKTIVKMNKYLINVQFTNINKIITYIDKKDYFGEQYHNLRNKQIEASIFWSKTFYLKNSEEIEKKRKELLKDI